MQHIPNHYSAQYYKPVIYSIVDISLLLEQAVFLPTVFTCRNVNGRDGVQLSVRQRRNCFQRLSSIELEATGPFTERAVDKAECVMAARRTVE